MKKTQKTITGLWDISILVPSLGGLINFTEGLLIQRLLRNADFVDVCFLDKDNTLRQKHPNISILKNLEGIDDISYCGNEKEFEKISAKKNTEIWPVKERPEEKTNIYSNTLYIQKYYHNTGKIPYLSMKSQILKKGFRLLKNYIYPKLPVVVHLKNNPKTPQESNADFTKWYKLFTYCEKTYSEVVFLLIGNEPIPDNIKKLSNVIISENLYSDISSDLVLIQLSYFFMGMASGPCNMAIFSKIPYVLFKDPNHHHKEMLKEIGKSDKFSFASEQQNIFRSEQNINLLIREFKRRHSMSNLKLWIERINKYDK